MRLCKLVIFTQDPQNYPPPAEHLDLFGMLRLADFLGVDSSIETAATWLGVRFGVRLSAVS